MVLATLVLLCAVPQTGDGAKLPAALSVTAFKSTSKDSIVTDTLPSAPEPKVIAAFPPAQQGSPAWLEQIARFLDQLGSDPHSGHPILPLQQK